MTFKKAREKLQHFFAFELHYQLYPQFYCRNAIEIQWYTKEFVSNNSKKNQKPKNITCFT